MGLRSSTLSTKRTRKMPIIVDDIIVNRKKRNGARTLTMSCTTYSETEPVVMDELEITVDTDYMGLNPYIEGFEDELQRDVYRHYNVGMSVEELTNEIEKHWWGWGACYKKVQPPTSRDNVFRPKRLY